MPTLSIVLNTKNCASTLERCLTSVVGADEIVVVDMESSDATVAIAEQFADAVYSFPEAGYADPARNFALSKVHGDWTLIVDADEVIPDELWARVQRSIENPIADIYRLPRRNSMFGYWMKDTGWWPDYQVRLFRTGSVIWNEGVHSQPKLLGTVAEFPAEANLAIEHYNYVSISDFLERLDRYTFAAANNSEQTSSATPLTAVAKFRSELLRRLFAQHGLSDGSHGLALSFLQSFYEMIVELRRWEQQGFKHHEKPSESIAQLRDFQKQLNYWIADYSVASNTGIAKLYWQIRRKLSW